MIENYVPIGEIEKNVPIEKSSVSMSDVMMHVYWARRPHINSRVFPFVAFAEDNPVNRRISNGLCKPDSRLNANVITAAKKVIGPGKKMLDPFSGAATHPIECARLGFESYGLDNNPVAVLIGKAVLEYSTPENLRKFRSASLNVYKRAKKKIGNLYDPSVWVYLWVQYIDCDCGYHLPLTRNTSLGNGVYVMQRDDGILEISNKVPEKWETKYERGRITCPKCGKTHHIRDSEITDRLLAEIVVRGGKFYRKPQSDFPEIDTDSFGRTKKKNTCFATIYENHEDHFNPRQLIANFTFVEEIRKETDDPAILTYLAMVFDRMIDYNSRLTVPAVKNKIAVAHTFTVLEPGFKGMYSETNPFYSGTHGWLTFTEQVADSIRACMFDKEAYSVFGNATSLPFDDDTFDFVFTDPPYYDLIRYTDISEFFYFWNRKILGNTFPDLYKGEIIDKSGDLVYRNNDDAYEKMMNSVFSEIRRVLKPGAPLVLVYMYKNEEGWEHLYNAIDNSGFEIKKKWYVYSEKPIRRNNGAIRKKAYYIYLK